MSGNNVTNPSRLEKIMSITSQVHNSIVKAFVTAFETMETTGNMVTQVCDIARKALKGEEMPSEARKLIAADIASARGWKDKTLTARTSEINVVLKAYNTLPEAVQGFRKRNGERCQWHDSMKLARRINAGDSPAQAVTAAFAKSEKKAVNHAGRVAGALKAWYESAKGAKRADILKAANLLGLERIGE